MTDAERRSREDFYGNLVWGIDGRGFRDNFDICHLLPAPETEIAQDLVWCKASRPMQGAARGLFFRLSEGRAAFPDEIITKATMRGAFYHGIHEIEADVGQAYRGHHPYDWVRPRGSWLDAACPVYIDFGDDHFVLLETYDESGLRCHGGVGRPAGPVAGSRGQAHGRP